MRNLAETGRTLFATMAFSALACELAKAASPFEVDDPDPTEVVELKLGGDYEKGRDGSKATTLGLGVGVPLGKGLEASVDLAQGWVRGGGQRAANGFGDTTIGMKARLTQHPTGDGVVAIGIGPSLVLPTGNEDRGLGGGTWRATLPVLAGVHAGAFALHANLGYARDIGNGAANATLPFGAQAQWSATATTVLGVELVGEAPASRMSAYVLDANAGFSVALHPAAHLQGLVGTNLRDPEKTGRKHHGKLMVKLTF